MDDLISLLSRFSKSGAEAKKMSAKHETSKNRVLIIEETLSRLSALNLKQENLFRQSCQCVESGLYRAAHVMGWAAMIDYIEEWFAYDGYAKLSQVHPKWRNIKSAEELRERSEFQIIEAFKKCDYCRKAMEKALKGLLADRNDCAHPSDYNPDLNASLGYLSKVLIRLEMLEKRKKNLFSRTT